MDLDKSLDEQIADKRQSQPRKAPRQSREGGGAGGREGRREALPYAVSCVESCIQDTLVDFAILTSRPVIAWTKTKKRNLSKETTTDSSAHHLAQRTINGYTTRTLALNRVDLATAQEAAATLQVWLGPVRASLA